MEKGTGTHPFYVDALGPGFSGTGDTFFLWGCIVCMEPDSGTGTHSSLRVFPLGEDMFPDWNSVSAAYRIFRGKPALT